jgi:pentatricopeptide repeat protein
MEQAEGLIDVRLMGPLEVRRSDGLLADPAEWRTAKTRDLFRILVLEQGRVVCTERILEALWPGADRAHGAASIRTAASRIRAVTGCQCIRRERGGLAIRGVRSDVDELQELVRQARELSASGDHVRTLRLIARNDRLLVRDLHADVLSSPSTGDGTWARRAHERVAGMQREVLALQAESAVEVGDVEDAMDLARWAIGSDPFWERPYRVLMRTLAAYGQPDEALEVYQRLQSVLHVERGAQPSVRTRRVREHIQWALTESMNSDVSPIPAQRHEQHAESGPAGPTTRRLEVARGSSEPPTGPLEQQVLRWLRQRGRGNRMRIQACLAHGPCEEFNVDLICGPTGTLEMAHERRALRQAHEAHPGSTDKRLG